MKNALKLFFILLVLLLQTGWAFAQPPPPPGETCERCDSEPGFAENFPELCEECPGQVCADDSIHILMAVGLVFGTFVIFKKINHKKTPI